MVGLLGINHKSAPISVRENYSFDPQEIIAFGNQLIDSKLFDGVVIISTCNRTEIYFKAVKKNEKDIYQSITDSLRKFKNYLKTRDSTKR